MTEEWVETTLGDVGEFINGYPFKPAELSGSQLPVIRIKQLLDPSAETDFTDVSVPDKVLLSDGDLVFSWSGSLASRIWDRGPAALNQHLFRVIERPGVDRGWLHLALDHAVDDLMEKAHGTTMKHVTKSVLQSHSVLLPPLPVQRRIVDLMAHLDNHIANLRAEIQGLRSVRVEMRRQSWIAHERSLVQLGTVIEGITAGRSPNTSGERPSGAEDGVLKVNSVDPSGEFFECEAKVLPSDHEMDPKWELVGGEVLVTRANTADRVAAVARVPASVRRGLYLCDKTLRLDIDPSVIDPDYLAEILQSPQARAQVAAMATGVGSSMVNISQAKICSWMIPVPGLEVQRERGNELQAVGATIAVLKEEERRLGSLRQAFLHNLLNGELTLVHSYDRLLSEVA